jgi:hypothetical protein
MRKHLFSSISVCLAVAGLAWADSLPTVRWEPPAERCANEITLMHGVWRGSQAFLPAYADLHLVEYLASLGARQAGVAVVPVFSSEAIYFRSDNIVFLSTGFILKAESETELTEAIQGARIEVRTRKLPACAAMTPWAPSSFADIRQMLAGQVSGYEDVTLRRLRSRGPGTR